MNLRRSVFLLGLPFFGVACGQADDASPTSQDLKQVKNDSDVAGAYVATSRGPIHAVVLVAAKDEFFIEFDQKEVCPKDAACTNPLMATVSGQYEVVGRDINLTSKGAIDEQKPYLGAFTVSRKGKAFTLKSKTFEQDFEKVDSDCLPNVTWHCDWQASKDFAPKCAGQWACGEQNSCSWDCTPTDDCKVGDDSTCDADETCQPLECPFSCPEGEPNCCGQRCVLKNGHQSEMP